MSKILVLDNSLKTINQKIELINEYESIWDFSKSGVRLETLIDTDWDSMKQDQLSKFKSCWEETNGIPQEVHFMGLTSIPAAFHLGSLFENIPKFYIKNLHHHLKEWEYLSDFPTVKVIADELRKNKIYSNACGDAIVRIYTSHKVEEQKVRAIVPNEILQIEIRTEQLGEDILKSFEDVKAVADKWKEVLDWIDEALPNVERIHLFASVPVGLAFLLGTKISPTLHKPVLIYQYSSSKKPFHHPAIEVGGSSSNYNQQFSKDDIETIQNTFTEFKENNFKKIKSYITNALYNKKVVTWLEQIFPSIKKNSLSNKIFDLLLLSEIPITDSNLKYSNLSSADFYSLEERAWVLNEQLLFNFIKSFPDGEERMKAIRLFIFHECIHKPQGLTSKTAISIGDYCRVVEVIDYQADVYAFLNEFGYARLFLGQRDLRNNIMNSILIGTRTMWSFVPETVINFIEQRRFFRLFNWYWKYVEILNAKDDEIEILNILLEQPVLDIRGLLIQVRNGRVSFSLDFAQNKPEIAIFYQNKLKQLAHHRSLNLNGFIAALRNKNEKEIIENVKSMYDHIRS